MNVPLTVLIAFAGVFIGAWFQRRHWHRSVTEEVRVRETKDASELIELIAKSYDQRIVAQRMYLHSMKEEDASDAREKYRAAIIEYFSSFNTIRSKLFFYFSYRKVLELEQELHERLVANGTKIAKVHRLKESTQDSSRIQFEVSALDEELSVLSAKVFMVCRDLYQQVSERNFGTLRKIDDWSDPKNEFTSVFGLARRILNI